MKNSVRVLIGGAPVTNEFAYSIGVDEYAADAGSAAVKVKQLIS